MTLLLNADIGESYGPWTMGNDAALMPVIDMANIACGGHASDPVTMQKTVRLALSHGITLGAHPSYPDLLGFGRRPMALPAGEIEAHVLAQIGALAAIIQAEGGQLSYVKPHGALYNTMIQNPEVMDAVMRAVSRFDANLRLMILSTNQIAQHADKAAAYGLVLIREAFADRRYTETGELDDRANPGAVYHRWDDIAMQVQRLVTHGEVIARNGDILSIQADSLCVHGDNPESIRTAGSIRSLLDGHT
jgi:UPF0271 protein